MTLNPDHLVPQQSPPRRRGLPVIGVLAVIVAVFCGVSLIAGTIGMVAGGPVDADRAGVPTASGAMTLPSYSLVSETDRRIVVAVDVLPPGDGLRRIFDTIRSDSGRADGGYFVEINCSTGGTAAVDNRLANGKFAVGRLGAAQVGLPAGGHEFAAVEGRTCPAASTPTHSPAPAPGRQTYLDQLRLIDPGLVVREDRAISRAENTCLDIFEGKTGDQLVRDVVTRLSGGGTTIDTTQARQAIKLMQKWICPTWQADWMARHPK